MASRNNVSSKNAWTLLLLVLAGVVLGAFLGEFASGIKFLSWLGFGKSFGLTSPIVLDLGILILTFGINITINIASIIGILIAVIIYKLI